MKRSDCMHGLHPNTFTLAWVLDSTPATSAAQCSARSHACSELSTDLFGDLWRTAHPNNVTLDAILLFPGSSAINLPKVKSVGRTVVGKNRIKDIHTVHIDR